MKPARVPQHLEVVGCGKPVWANTQTRSSQYASLSTKAHQVLDGHSKDMPVDSKAQALSFLASSVKRKRPALRPETGSTEREGEACQLLRPSPVTADTDRQREGQDWPSGNTDRTDTPAAESLLLSKPAETSSLLTWATSRPARSLFGPSPHPMTLLSRHPDAFAQQAGLLCKGQGQGSQQLLGMLAYQPVQSSHIPEDAREHTTAAEGSKPTCRAAASRWKFDRLVKESH